MTWSLEDTENYDRPDSVESAGWMARLASVREELLRGDLRSLYIGWLKAISTQDANSDKREPLALKDLGPLTAAQRALVAFLEVDIDLLAGGVQR